MQYDLRFIILNRLPSLIKEYDKIIRNYRGKNSKAKMVNYLTTKYAKEKGKNKHETVLEKTGLNRDRINDIKRDGIRENEMDTFICFCFGLGISFEEAIVLAFHENILFLSDNTYARKELKIFLLLENEEFRNLEPARKVEKARELYSKRKRRSKEKRKIINKYLK